MSGRCPGRSSTPTLPLRICSSMMMPRTDDLYHPRSTSLDQTAWFRKHRRAATTFDEIKELTLPESRHLLRLALGCGAPAKWPASMAYLAGSKCLSPLSCYLRLCRYQKLWLSHPRQDVARMGEHRRVKGRPTGTAYTILLPILAPTTNRTQISTFIEAPISHLECS
jgi:hypothetical protein